jgi:putative ABC transport system permease protein
MGSHRRQLIFQFLTETFVLTLHGHDPLPLLMPFLLKIFADFIPEDFHFNLLRQPGIIGFLALSSSRRHPPLRRLSRPRTLRLSNPSSSSRTRPLPTPAKTRSAWLRKSLTVSQFVIAQVFIIGTLLVSQTDQLCPQ